MVMATYQPGNSVPAVWYPGLKDNSGRGEIYEPVVLPMHVPLFFGYAPKGQTVAQFTNGGGAIEHYGAAMFDLRSKYATLVTPFLRLMNKYSNPYLFQRLRPADAGPEANLCLAIEIVETEKLREYQRNSLGHYAYDPNNARIPTSSEISGVVARWKVLPAQFDVSSAGLGKRTVTEGNGFYENDPTKRSTIYPIFEFQAQWFGEYGNNIGVRLFPLRNGNKGYRSDLVRDQQTALLGIQVVRREDAKSRPSVVPNNIDENTTVFSLRPEAFDRQSGNSIFFDDVFLDNYRDFSGTGGRPYRYGDIGGAYLYQDNIETVLTKMFEAERNANGASVRDADRDGHYLINFLTGTDSDNRPYKAVEVLGVLSGGDVSLTSGSTHYLDGGSDGTMSNKLYDDQVREELMNFGRRETKFLDLGRYPFRQFYDVGFSSRTKEAMCLLLTKRQDVCVSASTCDFITYDKGPDIAAEASIGASLSALLRGIPESEEFGTPCYRANIIPQAGRLIHEPAYRKFVPATYQLAKWRANYMSGADGLKEGKGYDSPPYNHVDELKELTNTWADAGVWERNWEQGMTHFRYKTDKLLFCPGVKTVYRDDTSVLTSDITMQITLDINAFAYTVWANLTGVSKMTDEELISASDNMITEFARGRYDGRVLVVPRTHLTRKDQNAGYSWTCQVDLYANNMKTVMKSFIVAYRMGDAA